MADQAQNPFSIFGGKYGSEPSGPLAQYLSGQQPPPDLQQAQLQPSGREGKVGGTAFFLDQFLRGAQQGAFRKQQQELAKEQTSENVLNDYLRVLQDKDPTQAKQLAEEIVTARGQKAMQFLEGATSSKGKGKGDGQQNPHSHILNALKSLGQGMLGGKVEKFKGYDKVPEWSQRILAMPNKDQAQQRDVAAFNNKIQEISQKVKQQEGREPYIDEIMGNPEVRNAGESIKSLYGVDPTAGFKDAYARDPDFGLSPDDKAAKRAEAKTNRIKQEYVGDLLKNIKVAGTSLPGGIKPEDIAAGIFKQEFGVTPKKTTIITVENPKTHEYQMAQEVSDPTTGTTEVLSRDGKPLEEDWVKTNRVDQARPMQRFVSNLNGQRVWTVADMSDPDKVKIIYPRDDKGNVIHAPEPGSRSEIDRTAAMAVTSYKQFQDRKLNTEKAKSTALNQVRNSTAWIAADPAGQQRLEQAATKPYDALLQDLKPQLKAQLALVAALTGNNKLIQGAVDAGVIDQSDADSVGGDTGDEDVDTTRIAPPIRQTGGAPVPSASDVHKLRRNAPPR